MPPDFQDFRTRQVPLGYTENLGYERALLTVEDWTWVVLREDRKRLPGCRPVLTSCFEYIANAIRTELVVLQGNPDRLRFFHCSYQMPQTGQLDWSVREVLLRRVDGLYAWASWAADNPDVTRRISEALNLSRQPQRMLP